MIPLILIALVSLVFELTVLLFFKLKNPKFIILFIITNLITNLSMNLSLGVFSSYLLGLIILEVTIFIIESLIYNLMLKKIKLSLMILLLCNLTSLVGGLVINILTGGGL